MDGSTMFPDDPQRPEGGKATRKGKVPMRNTEADDKVTSDLHNVTADELRQFIERIEQLLSEKADIAEQVKDVYCEIKGRGFDTKAIRKIIVLRKKDPQERQEEQAQLDLYMAVLGME